MSIREKLEKLTYAAGKLALADQALNVMGGLQKYVFLKRLDLMARYNGGWVLVTGATSGIGKAYAMELAKEGFNVILIARNAEALVATERDILAGSAAAGKHIKVKTVVFDYNTLDSLEAARNYMKLLHEVTKDLDLSIVINNVGCYIIEHFVTDTAEFASEMINVNIKSQVYTTKALLPGLLARKPKAAIISVTSNPQSTPLQLTTMYSAAKIFNYTFSRSLRDAYGKQVDVLTVVPSSTKSN